MYPGVAVLFVLATDNDFKAELWIMFSNVRKCRRGSLAPVFLQSQGYGKQIVWGQKGSYWESLEKLKLTGWISTGQSLPTKV